MSLTDELQKLAQLHQAGHLTDQEFADAKKRLISDEQMSTSRSSPEGSPAPEQHAHIEEKSYRSSRLSSGNFFFPDRLTLADDGMLFRKGAIFGYGEEHINYSAVASFRVNNKLFFSDISIETSGGSQPIFMNGLWKAEAREIQEIIREFQRKI